MNTLALSPVLVVLTVLAIYAVSELRQRVRHGEAASRLAARPDTQLAAHYRSLGFSAHAVSSALAMLAESLCLPSDKLRSADKLTDFLESGGID